MPKSGQQSGQCLFWNRYMLLVYAGDCHSAVITLNSFIIS